MPSVRPQPLITVTDVHVNPNAGHRELVRDRDGYLVVLAVGAKR